MEPRKIILATAGQSGVPTPWRQAEGKTGARFEGTADSQAESGYTTRKARSICSPSISAFFRESERSVSDEHMDALLRAILVVFQKHLPPDQVEPAIHELGRATDIEYERLSGART
jgi:hypothetical protein